jgi:hypothetical protein
MREPTAGFDLNTIRHQFQKLREQNMLDKAIELVFTHLERAKIENDAEYVN